MTSNLSLNIKRELYQVCVANIQTRLNTIKATIFELDQALLSETKSSAGDKHETGRARIQLERENVGRQLAEVEKTQHILSKIDVNRTSQTIGLGSVVITDRMNYFLAISLGEIRLEHTEYYAISPHAPIGRLLMGKTTGDTIAFREQHFEIRAVL